MKKIKSLKIALLFLLLAVGSLQAGPSIVTGIKGVWDITYYPDNVESYELTVYTNTTLEADLLLFLRGWDNGGLYLESGLWFTPLGYGDKSARYLHLNYAMIPVGIGLGGSTFRLSAGAQMGFLTSAVAEVASNGVALDASELYEPVAYGAHVAIETGGRIFFEWRYQIFGNTFRGSQGSLEGQQIVMAAGFQLPVLGDR